MPCRLDRTRVDRATHHRDDGRQCGTDQRAGHTEARAQEGGRHRGTGAPQDLGQAQPEPGPADHRQRRCGRFGASGTRQPGSRFHGAAPVGELVGTLPVDRVVLVAATGRFEVAVDRFEFVIGHFPVRLFTSAVIVLLPKARRPTRTTSCIGVAPVTPLTAVSSAPRGAPLTRGCARPSGRTGRPRRRVRPPTLRRCPPRSPYRPTSAWPGGRRRRSICPPCSRSHPR
jgi:hypothetical protein